MPQIKKDTTKQQRRRLNSSNNNHNKNQININHSHKPHDLNNARGENVQDELFLTRHCVRQPRVNAVYGGLFIGENGFEEGGDYVEDVGNEGSAEDVDCVEKIGHWFWLGWVSGLF